jgi:hypothetical protein
LSITSWGGDVEGGIPLGSWVFDRGLDVEVPEHCFSSCANYVFPAGKHKKLGHHAWVAWHGGITQDWTRHLEKQLAEIDEKYHAEVRKKFEEVRSTVAHDETEFYAKIGVDQRITTLGQMPPYKGNYKGYLGWDYSIDDLETLGVRNIRVAGEEWEPVAPKNRKLFRVQLSAVTGLTNGVLDVSSGEQDELAHD